MITAHRFTLRYNKAGKLLTQILHYGDFTVLISKDGIKAHYRIKDTGTRTWGWDIEYPTIDTNFVRGFRTFTGNSLPESSYDHLAKQIVLYQMVW